MTQTTWNDFTESEPEPEPEDQEPLVVKDLSGKESCPWCYAPKELYHEVPAGTACSVCSSMIPTDAEWYKNGEKVVAPADVADFRLEEIRERIGARRSSREK